MWLHFGNIELSIQTVQEVVNYDKIVETASIREASSFRTESDLEMKLVSEH